MDRQPVVAGQFYPGNGQALRDMVEHYLQGLPTDHRTLLAMAPHAGYVFSGEVAGSTIASASLADRIILLGPNHTGRGLKLAVWSEGKWLLPEYKARVDAELAKTVLGVPGFSADYEAHLHEHSLEVILPFLAGVLDDFSIVPVAVSEPDLNALVEAGKNLGLALKNIDIDVSLIVSTDMSHYVSHDQAEKIDRLAIEQILVMDPEGLYRVVTEKRISMCGVLPMVLGLACVRELGAKRARLTGYATSGHINNDYSRVVGYAGVLIS